MDGVTDDTAIWQAAIKLAGVMHARQIAVPAGISSVSGQIVNAANPLPHGLSFFGEGPADGSYQIVSRLRYTGPLACWSIAYQTGAPRSIGSWLWERMAFSAPMSQERCSISATR